MIQQNKNILSGEPGLFQPMADTTASHSLWSLSCSSPLSHRSVAVSTAAARWRQNLSPTSTSLSSPLSRGGSQSEGTSRRQLSVTPFFASMCSWAEIFISSSRRSRVVWTLNLGVLPNVHSQLRSSAAALLSPGNTDSSAGSTRVVVALRLNSEHSDWTHSVYRLPQ